MKPAGLSQVALAAKMGLSVPRLNRIVRGRVAVTAPLAILLAATFTSTKPEMWLRLQAAVDLWEARELARRAAALQASRRSSNPRTA